MGFNFCPECGHKLDKSYKFCPGCGYKLAEESKYSGPQEAAKQVKSARPNPSDIKEYQSAKALFDNGKFKESLSTIKKYADMGEAEAQFLMGCYYDPDVDFCSGNDEAKTFYWYKKAAEQGHAQSMSNLAVCYEYGKGVAKDIKQALYWAQKAVDCGDKYDREIFSGYLNDLKGRIANNTAGKSGPTKKLSQAEQDEENLKEAEKLYYDKQIKLIFPMVKNYAEQGNAKGQWLLGMCYCGQGIETPYEDPQKCVYWFKKAVEKGNTSAMISLGQCYNYGYGVDENLREARRLYQKALDSGDKSAKMFLDMMDIFD